MSLQLARETRERFITATAQVVEPLAQAIQDKLSAAASQMGNARDMQDWRDDFLAFQAQGGRWVAATQSAWRKALGTATPGLGTNSLSRLELMGDEVVETNILSSRLAQAILGKSSFEINDLRLRIQHLEGTSELDGKDALKPEALARVLVEQWLAMGLTRGLWTRTQDVIERHVVEASAKAYADANGYLVAKGVMPEIDLKSFVKRTASAAPARCRWVAAVSLAQVPRGMQAPDGPSVPVGSRRRASACREAPRATRWRRLAARPCSWRGSVLRVCFSTSSVS